ncbi:MAG: SGNH/GDSL hydrolase family protein, partial [Phototrophicaceae bacterium]
MTLAGFLIGLIGVGALLVVLAVQRRYRRPQSVARGLLVSYAVIVLALAAGEFYVRYIYADSRMEFGLHGMNWANKYIERNSLGFRDREWTVEELESRTTVFVLGDSFTEGWGINNPADRYTAVLQRHLGDDYAVVTLARAGQSTINELEFLETYPYQPPRKGHPRQRIARQRIERQPQYRHEHRVDHRVGEPRRERVRT